LLGQLDGARVAFVGEGNNVSRSLAQACVLAGAEFVSASPEGHGLEGAVTDPAEAVEGANIVYTDVWVSMGGEDSDERRALFEPYQVDEALMARSPNAWFMHCLPARRGEEVTAPVIDGPRSAVWRQAANRMHSARGAMLWTLGAKPQTESKNDEEEAEGGAGLFGRAGHVDHPEMAADRV
jgi:ornithine carbamoyltransferase